MKEDIDSVTIPSGRSPPFVNADIGASGEPGIQHKDTSEGSSPGQTLSERGIVVQSQSFTEPMNCMLFTVTANRCHLLHLIRFVVSAAARHAFVNDSSSKKDIVLIKDTSIERDYIFHSFILVKVS